MGIFNLPGKNQKKQLDDDKSDSEYYLNEQIHFIKP
jgi:hypothetical protein